MAEADEGQIRARISDGDTEALATYLESRRPELLRFIERNMGGSVGRKTSAEDVFQEVSMSCLNSHQRVDLKERDPYSWFCRLAERRIIDIHRAHFQTQKRDARKEVDLTAAVSQNSQQLANMLVSSVTSPSQIISRDEQQQQLAMAIENLSPSEQEALQLRYLENLPSKEIASRLGKADGAVRTLLSRAIKRLEQAMSSNS